VNYGEGVSEEWRERFDKVIDKYAEDLEIPDGHELNVSVDKDIPTDDGVMFAPDKNTIVINPDAFTEYAPIDVMHTFGHELVHIRDHIRYFNDHGTSIPRGSVEHLRSEINANQWQLDTRQTFKLPWQAADAINQEIFDLKNRIKMRQIMREN
jgi:hypothetical protein